MSHPSFEDFYRAVHDRAPFPWQKRLAAAVLEDGWPAEIGVPTGLGKTSCIDIAVWALAAQSTLPPGERTMPTRIWYVVNRRLLVDAASDHAEYLSSLLVDALARDDGRQPDPRIEILRSVAQGLAGISAFGSSYGRPLFVSRLRGGSTVGRRPFDPSQPAVLCATVPMFGSRLLMRGFGASNGMWPIDAAHAGIDSLILLDEAHLAAPLQKLLGVLTQCDANYAGVLRPPRRVQRTSGPASLLPLSRAYPTLVSLTATGSGRPRFDLDADDLGHEVVSMRLAAAKLTTVVHTTVKDRSLVLAESAVGYMKGSVEPTSVVVFCNSPRTVRDVRSEFERLAAKAGVVADVEVLTGQMRALEADGVRQRLLNLEAGLKSGAPCRPQRNIAIIATQTLEVGADLDFDFLVTESAGVRAITQRLGRLNRLGLRSEASATIVHASDDKTTLYGLEPAAVVSRIEAAGTPADLSPSQIAGVLGSPQDEPERVPELLGFHLWEFAKTSLPPEGAAPPEVFFAGIETDLTVSLAWRAELPGPGTAIVPALSANEFVDIGLGEARAFLEQVDCRLVAADAASVETVKISGIRPGQRFVVAASSGGYGAHGFDPGSNAEVLDVSPLYSGAVGVTPLALAQLCGELDDGVLELLRELRSDDEDEVDLVEVGRTLHRSIALICNGRSPFGSEWRFEDSVFRSLERMSNSQCVLYFAFANQRAKEARVEALDELSNAPRAALGEHLRSVGEAALRIAISIGLPRAVADAVAGAGRFHDLGKADPRFQLWLDPTSAEPLAKSNVERWQWERRRIAAQWPKGARHELLSVQLIDAALAEGLEVADSELVRHLVISHHGGGRPLCNATHDSAPIRTTFEFDGFNFSTLTDPGRADYEQAERFRDACERFGYWGLCLLEATLRQADHLVSEVTEVE